MTDPTTVGASVEASAPPAESPQEEPAAADGPTRNAETDEVPYWRPHYEIQTPVRKTLLSKLGGPAKFRAIVNEFYFRVLDDDLLTRFFEGINMNKLKWHTANLISTAFDRRWDVQDVEEFLGQKHDRLFDEGLGTEHFDAFVGHLIDTMKFLGADGEAVREAEVVMRTYRPIFERGAKEAKRREELAAEDDREERIGERWEGSSGWDSLKEKVGEVLGGWDSLSPSAKERVGLGVAVAVLAITTSVVLRGRRP